MMATAAENRAAQRRNAKAQKTGTYQKTSIGAKARRVATNLKREPLANAVMSHAIRILEPSGATRAPVDRDRMERRILGDELLQKAIGTEEFMATIGLPHTTQYPGMSLTDLSAALGMTADEWRERAREDALAGLHYSPFFYK
jgi:hypothetical protein